MHTTDTYSFVEDVQQNAGKVAGHRTGRHAVAFIQLARVPVQSRNNLYGECPQNRGAVMEFWVGTIAKVIANSSPHTPAHSLLPGRMNSLNRPVQSSISALDSICTFQIRRVHCMPAHIPEG